MSKNKKIKKGQLLWWRRIGNSTNQNINCPCVVTQVKHKHFTVTSLDDFMESDLIPIDSTAHLEEMSPTKSKDVLSFLDKKSAMVEKRVKKAKEELRNASNDRMTFIYERSKIKWALE